MTAGAACSRACRRTEDPDLIVELLCWFYFQDSAGFLVGQHVQQTIRALPHIPDSLMKIDQEGLPSLFPFIVEHNALQMSGSTDAADGH